MRPYTPLELAGRNIYVREGCYICHSQMIRPFRDEVERYGHYSLAAESMYDHPFQWGSKRTGPDLARVGGRYSDDWHVQHLIDPRSRGAGVDHAGLRASWQTPTSTPTTSPTHLAANARSRRALHRRDDRQRRTPTCWRRPTPNADTPALVERYPKAQVARLRRRSQPRHRDGCARRLPADARHAGRLLHLRRRRRLPLRSADGHLSTTPCATSPTAGVWSAWSLIFLAVADLRLPAAAPRRQRDRSCAAFRSTMTRRDWSAIDDRRARSTKSPASTTTGHEWDGIKELNKPLPRWWLWTFYAMHRLRARLHVALSGLAAGHLGNHAACSAIRAAARSTHEIAAAEAGAGRHAGADRGDAASTRFSPTTTCALRASPAGARRSRSTASSATAPGAAGLGGLSRTSTTTTGSGAARSTRSIRRIAHGVRFTADADTRYIADAGLRRRRRC